MLVKSTTQPLLRSCAITHETAYGRDGAAILWPTFSFRALQDHIKHGLYLTARVDLSSFKGVGLDLDGTLVNTDYNPNGGVNLQQESWVYAAATFCLGKGHELPSNSARQIRDIFESTPNNPVTGFFTTLTAAGLLPKPIQSPLELDHALEPIREEYMVKAAIAGKIELLPGARSNLIELSRCGRAIGLYTSSTKSIASLIMERALDDELEALIPTDMRVFGDEVEDRRKPDPAGFLLLSKRMSLDPQNLIYIGNSAQDLLGSQEAGYGLSVGVGNEHGRMLRRYEKLHPEKVVVVSNLTALTFEQRREAQANAA